MGSRDAFLYAFDLLEINGTDLRRDAWQVRRATLTSLLRKTGDGVRLSEHIEGADGATIFGHACAHGLGGHRGQAPGSALSIGALAGLDQGQEPGRAGRDQADRRLTPAVLV
jgi:hypothetical protein